MRDNVCPLLTNVGIHGTNSLSVSLCFIYFIIFWNFHQGWIYDVRRESEIQESFISHLAWKTLSGKGGLKLLTTPKIPTEASSLTFWLLLQERRLLNISNTDGSLHPSTLQRSNDSKWGWIHSFRTRWLTTHTAENRYQWNTASTLEELTTQQASDEKVVWEVPSKTEVNLGNTRRGKGDPEIVLGRYYTPTEVWRKLGLSLEGKGKGNPGKAIIVAHLGRWIVCQGWILKVQAECAHLGDQSRLSLGRMIPQKVTLRFLSRWQKPYC